MENQKVIINRRLNLDGTWQEYTISPPNAYGKISNENADKTFSSLNEIIKFFNLKDVRELGTKYTYDNKGNKYGIEKYESYLTI
jgi:hypothetical protein